jgi:hypothetical protein
MSKEPQDEQLDLSVEIDDETTAEHDKAGDAGEPTAESAPLDTDTDDVAEESDDDEDANEASDEAPTGGDDDDDGGSRIARLDWDGDSVDASDALLDRA